MDLVVPYLRPGKGETPSEGGCIMQVTDWIHRHRWSDTPVCVHPVLRDLAISANDNSGHENRQLLLDLIPRLIGTSDYAISGTQHNQVVQAFYGARDKAPSYRWVSALIGALDKFDEFTGHKASEETIDYGELCKVASTRDAVLA